MKITREIESTSVYLQKIKGFHSFFNENKELSNYKFSEETQIQPEQNQEREEIEQASIKECHICFVMFGSMLKISGL